MHQGDARGAIESFGEAQKLSDTWLGHFYLGRAFLELGGFAQAVAEFQSCQQRRGEATSIFLDDEPSYHNFPPVLYYLGRGQEGLHSADATASYKAYRALKTQSTRDPLAADATKRLAGSN